MSPPLHDDWHLHDDPFPFAGLSLAPQNDPQQLSHYLDFYDWGEAEIFKGLRSDGTVEVESLPGSGTTTILISGQAGSGRSSVKNLLVFQLQQGKTPAPIVLDVPVPPSPNRQQVAILLSMKLMMEINRRAPAAGAQVQQTINTWQTMAGSDPNAETLFSMLRQHVDIAAPGAEVIVTLDASSHNLTRDAARATNAMLRGFATYVIMSLTAPDDARFIKRNTLDGRRPAWIDAPGVEARTVKTYVAARLAAQRATDFAAPSDTFPFTSDAIDELFAATTGNDQRRISISIVLRRLAIALSRKSAQPGTPPVLITKADMQAFLA